MGPVTASGRQPAGECPRLVFRLLGGALLIEADGRPVILSSRLQHAVLTELVAADGAAIDRSTLIDRLWPAVRPGSADNLLSTHVARLRAWLDGFRVRPGSFIPRSAGGYRIDLTEAWSDLRELRRAHEQVRQGDGDRAEAHRVLERLRLPTSTDERLLEVVDGAWQLARQLVHELVQAAPSDSEWAQLETHLAAAHHRAPYDELVAAWWLRSLDASGRAGEGLEAYPGIVRKLRRELGISPGLTLPSAPPSSWRRLAMSPRPFCWCRRIGPARPGSSPRRGCRCPRPGSPAGPRRCAGWSTRRRVPLPTTAAACWWSRVGSGSASRPWPSPRPTTWPSTSATGRSGSTSARPDETIDPHAAVTELLVGLGQDPATLPPEPGRCLDILRSLTAHRSVLYVVDNAGPRDRIGDLIPNAPGSLVILTCRAAHQDAVGSPVLDLQSMTSTEALELLETSLPGRDLSLDTHGMTELLRLCEGRPVALRVCARFLLAHPGWSVDRLRTRLVDDERRLDAFSDPAQGLTAVFARAAQDLGQPSLAALSATGLLGLAQVEPWMVAAVLDVDVESAQDGLDDLAEARLIDDTTVTDELPVFTVSSLVRAFAARRRCGEDAATT